MEVSAALKPKAAHLGAAAWLESMRDSTVLLGAILKVVHPELYARSVAGLATLHGHEDFETPLRPWGSPFNALSIISNRQTPLHRDTQSRREWYDLLVTIGNYSAATLSLPGLGLEYPYPSGSISIFSGALLQHGVSPADEERICIAYYMREAVQKRMNTGLAGWMTVGQFTTATGVHEVVGS